MIFGVYGDVHVTRSGYITAYDLPEFRPRGSFCCKDRSDVKAIVDAQSDGLFLTAGLHGVPRQSNVESIFFGLLQSADVSHGQSIDDF